MIGDITIANNSGAPHGLAYTLFSRVTQKKRIKLNDFSPNKIKVNKNALQEMQQLRIDSQLTYYQPLI